MSVLSSLPASVDLTNEPTSRRFCEALKGPSKITRAELGVNRHKSLDFATRAGLFPRTVIASQGLREIPH